jgi:hypothetical protein
MGGPERHLAAVGAVEDVALDVVGELRGQGDAVRRALRDGWEVGQGDQVQA